MLLQDLLLLWRFLRCFSTRNSVYVHWSRLLLLNKRLCMRRSEFHDTMNVESRLDFYSRMLRTLRNFKLVGSEAANKWTENSR
jgi:hypothetical protein